jgi:hypothetical protein
MAREGVASASVSSQGVPVLACGWKAGPRPPCEKVRFRVTQLWCSDSVTGALSGGDKYPDRPLSTTLTNSHTPL